MEWYAYLLYRIGDNQNIGHKCSNGTVDVVMAIQSNWFSLVDQRLICVEKQDRWWPNGTYSEVRLLTLLIQ